MESRPNAVVPQKPDWVLVCQDNHKVQIKETYAFIYIFRMSFKCSNRTAIISVPKMEFLDNHDWWVTNLYFKKYL